VGAQTETELKEKLRVEDALNATKVSLWMCFCHLGSRIHILYSILLYYFPFGAKCHYYKSIKNASSSSQAAVEEGIVVGGGCMLLRLTAKVDAIKDTLENDEQKVATRSIYFSFV
jgi:chaperonin GroEL (HSP60 family)